MSSEVTPREHDLDTLMAISDGYRSMLLLKAANELQLFDHLEKHSVNGITAKDLAREQNWNESRCERLLNALAAIKMLTKESEGENYVFRCSSTGKCLVSTSTFIGYVNGMIKDEACFKAIPGQVKTASLDGVDFPLHVTFHKDVSKEAKRHEHGHNEKGDHEHCTKGHDHGSHGHHDHGNHGHHDHGNHGHHDHGNHGHHDHGNHGHHDHGNHGHDHGELGHHGPRDPEKLAQMYKYYVSYGNIHSKRLVTTYNLGSYKTTCDLGGGTGIFSYELCRNYPNMTVTLFDVPPTIEMVQKYFFPKDENLNVKLLPGDFTETDLPHMDLYLMSLVLHDWGDKQIATLLDKVHAAINKGGALMIFEKCMDDDKAGPVMANLWDMMVMSHCSGKLRSESEYRELLTEHGYGDIQITKSSNYCMYDVIYAKKLE